ncbi:hypothetical protein [Rhizobium sp. NZLR4b]|uniref:hypothetical protein n=1 Tax=Rhizobium sp. NZLR4b TaxID=2731102 RepID=UPI001C8298A5|nr:hypothetical protein [Rhizobium sp. NZLR4b]MBX5164817.1 hypothetical protein [Rhizobium sp. NZLR4b]
MIVFLSLLGWRNARTADDGVFSSAASAFVGLFFGLILWLILVAIFGSLFSK